MRDGRTAALASWLARRAVGSDKAMLENIVVGVEDGMSVDLMMMVIDVRGDGC